tara:strand:- start:4142 stop:4246 length:105 start_codon:yes stop_codon:yes gene_type:complete
MELIAVCDDLFWGSEWTIGGNYKRGAIVLPIFLV